MAQYRWMTALATAVPLILVPLAPTFASPQETVPAAPPSAAAPEQLTDRLIVKYDRPTTDAEAEQVLGNAAAEAGVPAGEETTEVRTTAAGAVVVELSEAVTVEEAEELSARVAADPSVAWAEPDRLVSAAAAAPTDPAYRYQWGLKQQQAPVAWDAATGAGTVVGVVDTGITAHPDLDSKILGGYDFISDDYVSSDGQPGRDKVFADPGDRPAALVCGESSAGESRSSWHGTHVAGIVAAATNNGVQGAGIAPGAQLLIGRALGACGVGWVSDIEDTVRWMSGASVYGVPAAPKRADVINLSLGFRGDCPVYLQEAINVAVARGTTVVTAAGNTGESAAGFAPANCANVVTVGAATSAGGAADWSNHGTAVDVWAPGEEIYSTLNDGQHSPTAPSGGYSSGTSMAAPLVSGVVALLRQQNPAMTPSQLEAKLKSTAVRLPLGTTTQRQVSTLAALGLSATPELKGAIRTRYYADAATRTALGAPVAAEYSNGAGGSVQQFERGKIIWSAKTGARVLKGAIGSRHAAAGNELGTLGYPIAEERANGIGGSYQVFQRGKILWSAKTGARMLKGAIGTRYSALGSERGPLSYPTAEEKCGLKDRGCVQVFQKGRIYWSPKTGVQSVNGAIGTRHTQLGAERSRLGYPTSGEYRSGTTTAQNFQGGKVTWSSRAGVRVTYR